MDALDNLTLRRRRDRLSNPSTAPYVFLEQVMFHYAPPPPIPGVVPPPRAVPAMAAPPVASMFGPQPPIDYAAIAANLQAAHLRRHVDAALAHERDRQAAREGPDNSAAGRREGAHVHGHETRYASRRRREDEDGGAHP